MKGGIYTDEKCPVCGGKFIDNHRDALICPIHPKIKASSFKVVFGKLTKRFKSYDDADRCLTGFRFKTDEMTFDERDYKKSNPLGFSNISSKWMSYHLDEVKPGTRRAIRSHIVRAQEYFQNRNIKDLKYGDFEDFLKTLTLSDKTKHNILSTLHTMFVWLKKRQEINELPDFPTVNFELKMRRTISKDDQWAIIDEVEKIVPNQKIYLGIKWLSTYISIRPHEMLTLKEGDIDLDNGYLYFPNPKEKKFKAVPILQEDVEILKSFSKSFPTLPFFRHSQNTKGTPPNHPFSKNLFYNWWKKACSNLGIEGVDLYGGTRHSSARALRKFHSPEEIKRATMHTTNKAFERYFQVEAEDLRDIYSNTGKGKVVKIVKALSK